MSVFWNTLEKLDRAVILAAQKIEALTGKESFRASEEKRVEHVRPPQKAITFDA